MKRMYNHLKSYIVRGILAIIPLVLTWLLLSFLYVNIDRRITVYIENWTGYSIPGLGLLMLAVTLYIIGLVASNIIGKQLLGLVERITKKIPLVNSFYSVGKQIAGAFEIPDTSSFKRPVLIEYLAPGSFTLGFVTGSMRDTETGEVLLRVYVPTPPIPTSGVMIIVAESKVSDPGMTLEEALKIVMSAGIIGPDRFTLRT